MSKLLSMVKHYEGFLAHEQEIEEDDPNAAADRTLFLQLTGFELVLMKYALEWLATLYPTGHGIAELHQKLIELVHAQGFCDCEDCKREREEEDGS